MQMLLIQDYTLAYRREERVVFWIRYVRGVKSSFTARARLVEYQSEVEV